jgi:hypothetical protein
MNNNFRIRNFTTCIPLYHYTYYHYIYVVATMIVYHHTIVRMIYDIYSGLTILFYCNPISVMAFECS